MRSVGLLFATVMMATAQLRSVEMRVSGLDCTSCAESVGKRLSRMRGVESATFDPAKNVAVIKLAPENRVTLGAVRDTLKSLGYTPGDAVIEVQGELTNEGKDVVLSLPHQQRAFILEGAAKAGGPISGNVPAPKQGESIDRLQTSRPIH